MSVSSFFGVHYRLLVFLIAICFLVMQSLLMFLWPSSWYKMLIVIGIGYPDSRSKTSVGGSSTDVCAPSRPELPNRGCLDIQ